PPLCVTTTSTCPWIDHKVSRLPPLTKRPVWTRFRCGSVTKELNLASEEQLVGSLCKRHAVTRSALLRRAPTACRHTVSGTISLPYSGCFSPFPHGTCSLSVFQEYLALPDGSGWFRQDFSCPALLRILLAITHPYAYGAITLFGPDFHPVPLKCASHNAVLQPRQCRNISGLGCFPFARHYSGNHSCFLFLRLLRCFSSPGSPPATSAGCHAFSMTGCPIRRSADRS